MVVCRLQRTALILTIGASVLFASCIAPLREGSPSQSVAPRWLPVASSASAADQAPKIASRVISFETAEGTSISVDVGPDGETLVFDLLGDIYTLPFDGGTATPLTSGRAWDRAPRFSPDGAYVYFISDRKDYRNVWRLNLLDRSVQQVTRSESDIMGTPNWSQDGNHLLVGRSDPETHNTEFILHAVDPDTGSMMPIDPPGGPWIDLNTFETLRPRIIIYSGVESADGEVFFSQAQSDPESSRTAVRMYKFDLDTQTQTTITKADALRSEYKPQLSHDGTLLAYYRQYNDRRTEIRILNRVTGQDKTLIALANVDDADYYAVEDTTANYAFTPDDRELVFWHGGKIHRVKLADGSSEIIPFRVKVEREVWVRAEGAAQRIDDAGEATVIRWPSVSPDGQTMAFSAIGYVWVLDLQAGAVRRLTGTTDFEYMPAISPDGNSVAYVSFTQSGDHYGAGRLMVAELDGGSSGEVLADPNANYLLPKWSHDGSMIALIREVEGEAGVQDGIGGIDAAFGWTSVASGSFREVAPAPASSDPMSWYIYSRFVGFSKTGRQLVFSFPRSRNEIVLATAGLDGGSLRTLASGTPEVRGITPAPDLNNLALTRSDGTVWVVPFAVGEESSEVSTLTAGARRVSRNGGYYVDWNQPIQLTFGFAQNLYRYRLDNGALGSLRVEVPFSKPMAERPIAFKRARLITVAGDVGAGPVIESGTVVVDGARIAAIGPMADVAIPADALVIDASGKTIMPGLLDTHYHRIGGRGVSALSLPNVHFSDRSAIEYGITTAWEPGGPTDDGVPAAVDLQAAGRIAGPRWSHSAMGVVGYPFELLTDYSSALTAVEQHRDLGVDVLKEYDTPTRQQRQWLSAAAHQSGLGIVSHVDDFAGMMTRIVDGYTGGDHPLIPVPFFKDVRELLRKTGYIWTPNIVTTPSTVGSRQDKINYFCKAVSRWMQTNHRIGKGGSKCLPEQSSATVPFDIHRVGRVARQVASAASNGVDIGVSAHNMPGSNLHREMWYLWKGGMPIKDVLRAATIGNSEKLGLQEEIGSLEPGKIADFLVLDANPLDDILNTLSLEYTIQGGVVYNSTTGQAADLMSMRE